MRQEKRTGTGCFPELRSAQHGPPSLEGRPGAYLFVFVFVFDLFAYVLLVCLFVCYVLYVVVFR